jgi:DNA-binding response OmpR family regulator
VASVVRATLQLCGYRVLQAPNGREALSLSERHEGSIPLLITDLVMPGMSGLELAVAIRKSRPETKVLFISGYSERAFSSQTVTEMGAVFLQKPFMPHALARRVRDVLDGTGAEVG